MTLEKAHDRGNPWPVDVKADAVSRLMLGEREYDVAKATGVPLWTIKHWHKDLPQYRDEMLARMIDRERFGVLVSEFLEAALTNVTTVLEVTQADPTWIKQQNARDLAAYVDIVTARVTAIASALGGQSTTQQSANETD